MFSLPSAPPASSLPLLIQLDVLSLFLKNKHKNQNRQEKANNSNKKKMPK